MKLLLLGGLGLGNGGLGQLHGVHMDLVIGAEGVGVHLGLGGGDALLDLLLVLVAPVSAQVQLADLGDEGIDGVAAGALIVEGVLAHLVEACHELGGADAGGGAGGGGGVAGVRERVPGGVRWGEGKADIALYSANAEKNICLPFVVIIRDLRGCIRIPNVVFQTVVKKS